tara:strand:+ start:2008 stop:2406 length:399 start_codon:yes stop_codon:yes gene_type:complete
MSIQNKCVLQAQLSEETVGDGEDHYIVMPHEGEWKLDAAYFCPNAATTAHASNTATLAVKQGATSVVTSQVVSTGGIGSLVAGTKLTFAIPASAGASLEFGQGDILHIDIDKASSGVAVTGDWTFSFKQIVS